MALCGADNESEHEAAGGDEASASHLPWNSFALMWLCRHTHSLDPYEGAPTKDPVEVLQCSPNSKLVLFQVRVHLQNNVLQISSFSSVPLKHFYMSRSEFCHVLKIEPTETHLLLELVQAE